MAPPPPVAAADHQSDGGDGPSDDLVPTDVPASPAAYKLSHHDADVNLSPSILDVPISDEEEEGEDSDDDEEEGGEES